MGRRELGGVIAVTAGALLIIALLLPWWGYPSAFENPAELPEDAQLAASLVAEGGGRSSEPDAFEFFGLRDILFLVAGLVGFGFGLCLLVWGDRIPVAASLAVGAVALVALVFLVVTLVAPPDYSDLGPPGRSIDFGVSLPLHAEVGPFVALGAAVGLLAGVGLSLRHRPTGSA